MEKKYAVSKPLVIEVQVPDISHETLLTYVTEIDKSNIYLRLKGVNETHLKFEEVVYYPFDGKYKGLSSVRTGCHEYKISALIPFTEWANVGNLKGSLDGFVNYVWPKDVKKYIRFTFVRTYP